MAADNIGRGIGGAAPDADAPNLLEVRGLKKYFPIRQGLFRRVVGQVKAVDDVSLTIPAGRTVGLVGESGSGKTTLGLAILRLVESEGRIVVLGQDIANLGFAATRPLRRRMQIVFQDPYGSLSPRMTVGEIVGEGLRIHERGMPEPERRELIAKSLEEVGLTRAMLDQIGRAHV